ncbi:hypothetical protein DE146DRAFT_279520 [Phaeosphaeria sp. MPI-PUGE-AT-0046c]|nr:hypothetical protein DE146DRAFT_279520 [Phaeosphaeria sp. MPI-PUGE-AT-0046c]
MILSSLPLYHTVSMHRAFQEPQHSEHRFEDIELSSFPKHLPLRPDKPSHLRKTWLKTSNRIALAVSISIIIIVCAAVAAFSIGKSLQNSQYRKHSDHTPTRIVTPNPVTLLHVTQTSVVTSTAETLVSSWQSMEVATAPASASATAAYKAL